MSSSFDHAAKQRSTGLPILNVIAVRWFYRLLGPAAGLADGGQLVARDKDLHRNGALYLVDELAVEGDTAVHVEPEDKGTPDWD